ncbi:hypothetical protein O7627_10835 [Solwaraspora sp. WMMD1047]|uniref:hypothetical protein n=1 Tax=Solwaraspora sp. WMMD1047 TaxID=3016102 RepID=UPI0024169E45|nr:hypothetical protein [Solwaraspora sp. WMMD1047]MDG4829795.1 hypothetical protein [Solwaraspora sp. WMMD1047]
MNGVRSDAPAVGARPDAPAADDPTRPTNGVRPDAPNHGVRPDAPSNGVRPDAGQPADRAPATAADGAAQPARAGRWPSWRRDLSVYGFFLVMAVWVTSQIWLDPAGRVASLYSSDPAQVQYFLAHSVRVVLHGEYPFFTEQLNYPDGVNLMANTAILGLGIPMVPVTLLFGPAVTFVVLVTLALAGTASAWYYVLSRHLVRWPVAAMVGGWFCGFSPAMLSHANWHPNIISQFLLPFIVWRVLVLTRSTRVVRDGVILALLVTYQAFINEEILLFTALACGVFLLAMVAQRPGLWASAWRPLLGGVAVCAVVATALLAYPLYVQFAGRQAYHGLSDAVRDYGNDLAAFFAPGSTTLGGDRRANIELAPNYSEENAFFGWSLALLTVAIVVWLRRELIVRALAFTGLLFAVLSLGERVSWWSRGELWGPWDWLVHAPLLDAVVPTRFGLITSVVVALLLALAVDRAWTVELGSLRTTRTLIVTALVVALLPVLPLPLREVSRPPVPDFITSGAWEEYVTDDQTLVPVPVPAMGHTHGMRWAAATNLDFKIPGGYFLAPRNGMTGDPGRFGGRPNGLGTILDRVWTTGRPVTMTEAQRRRSLDELRYWRAAILVLPIREQNADPLRRTVQQIAGPGRQIDDVWVWDVRPVTTAPG